MKKLFIYILFLLILLSGCTGRTTGTPVEQTGRRDELMEKRAKTQIGIWYSVWYSNGNGSAPADNFWNAENILYKPLLPDGTYGRYDSASDEIIQYHLEEMTNAQIDFIIMDQTNDIDNGHGFINYRAIKTAKAIMQWNKDPTKIPIRYCSAVGVFAAINNDLSIIESEAKKIWERYIDREWGSEDYHIYVDGKPLLIIFETTKEQW